MTNAIEEALRDIDNAAVSFRDGDAYDLAHQIRIRVTTALELLSPAPGIDWKRVAEVRERHEACDRKEHPSDDLLYEAHADRAFLLSLLPDALKGEVKP